MTRSRTAIAALAVVGLMVGGLFLGARSTAGGSRHAAYEALLPRVLTAPSDPTTGPARNEAPSTFGLIASAAAAAGDDATATLATRQLMDSVGPGGWGTPWTWDPFGDGSLTYAGTPFASETALAIEGFLDRGVDTATARQIADMLVTWARDGWSDGYYWYSLAEQDAVYSPSSSAMMVGATARFLHEHGDVLTPSERALLGDRVKASIARLGTGDAGYLRWNASDRQHIVNDLNHDGNIIWGIELARDAGFEIPWSRADALQSLREYDLLYPIDASLTPSMSARYRGGWGVAGTGTALAVAARFGGDTRPWARKASVALEQSPFYPRFAADTLLGFALAGMCDCPGGAIGPAPSGTGH